MDKAERAKQVDRLNRFIEEYPDLAGLLVAQQTVLIEAAEQGNELVRERMTYLLSHGVTMPFQTYWEKQAARLPPFSATGIIGCVVAHRNRDPRSCFPPLVDWFDDPRPSGVPGKPPIGPLTDHDGGSRPGLAAPSGVDTPRAGPER